MSEWQPIKTIPMDGTPVLVWMPEPCAWSRIHVAVYRPHVTIIGGHFAFDLPSEPTHWRPLPAPPEPTKETQ